jgi:hypothetical protein
MRRRVVLESMAKGSLKETITTLKLKSISPITNIDLKKSRRWELGSLEVFIEKRWDIILQHSQISKSNLKEMRKKIPNQETTLTSSQELSKITPTEIMNQIEEVHLTDLALKEEASKRTWTKAKDLKRTELLGTLRNIMKMKWRPEINQSKSSEISKRLMEALEVKWRTPKLPTKILREPLRKSSLSDHLKHSKWKMEMPTTNQVLMVMEEWWRKEKSATPMKKSSSICRDLKENLKTMIAKATNISKGKRPREEE